MFTRRFALVLGVLFLVVGVAGFIPGITQMHGGPDNLTVHGPGHGWLLGLFHVNVLHNLVHIVFGIAGLACAGSFLAARRYAQFVAVAYGVLGVLGLISAGNTNTLWGLVPIEGNDVWLHLLIAAVSAYFGFAYRGAVEEGRVTGSDYTAPPAM
jgi:Domain of unknown function (DUF4383)